MRVVQYYENLQIECKISANYSELCFQVYSKIEGIELKIINMKIKFTITIIFLTFNILGYSQNIKKLYKYVFKNDYDKAIKESKKFEKLSEGEKAIAIFGIDTYYAINKSPVNVLNSYYRCKKISFNSDQKIELNKILAKYDFSIEKVQNIYEDLLFEYSKTIKNDNDFNKILEYCEDCIYKTNYQSMQIEVAYKNTISKNDISGYEYFLGKYHNTKYQEEIIKLRNELAYRLMPETISDYENYLKKYPASEFIDTVKKTLVKLYYQKAYNSQSINELSSFINSNKESEYAPKAYDAILNILVAKLDVSFSFENYFLLKKYDKQRMFINKYNEIFEEVSKNSDYENLNLRGSPKEMNLKYYELYKQSYDKFRESIKANCTYKFNNYGKLLERNFIDSYTDPMLTILEEWFPEDLKKNSVRIFIDWGKVDYNLVIYNFIHSIHSSGSERDNFYIYENNLLIEINGKTPTQINQLFYKKKYSFSYDNDGNLTVIDYYDNGKLNRKAKFNWENGKLVNQICFDGNGMQSGFEYMIRYFDNKIDVYVYMASMGYHDYAHANFVDWAEIKIETDNYNRITKKTCTGPKYGEYIEYSYTYKYDNNDNLLESQCLITDKVQMKKERKIALFNYDMYNNLIEMDVYNYQENRYSSEKQIGESHKIWKYKYDEVGNWIQREEYNVYKNDLTVEELKDKTIRTITY